MNKSESKYYNTAIKMNEAFLDLLNHKKFEFITVKEICEKACVNRSTFYLHYETINDLLVETGEYINNRFFSYFDGTTVDDIELSNMKDEELNFIKPVYLIPWLTFIKENKNLFQTVLKRFKTLYVATPYESISLKIINPVLKRLIPDEDERKYIFAFYVEGVMAIVKEWIKNGCDKDIEYISNLIVGCVNR